MEFFREELCTIFIWIKLPELDFKYWSKKGMSKIESLVGKPLMVDSNTEKKAEMNFARLLIEIETNATFPYTIMFKTEKGHLIEQKIYL